MKIKDFLCRCFNKIENNRIVIIISLCISVVIFSILGIWYTNGEYWLYTFYLIMAVLCLMGWVLLLFQDREKIDEFLKKSAYFIIGLVISVFTILFWILIFEGKKFDWYLYIPFAILIPAVITFLLNEIKLIFCLVVNTANQFLKKKGIQPKTFDFRSITSALVTVTGFLTALLGLIKLFEQCFKELFKYISI